MSRIRFLTFTVVLCLQAMAVSPASAAYPERDIKVIIPFSPGGGFDTYVRAVIPVLKKHLGGDINILPINSGGAGGRQGALETFRARPDGYTIGVFNMPGVLIAQLTEERTRFDLEKLTWLATFGNDPYAYVVNKDSPLKTFADIQAQKQPILYGATGPSSTSYVATVVMNEILGIPYEMVTGYTGSSEYTMGVMRGDVVAALVSLSTARPFIKSGDVRALAMIGTKSDDASLADAESMGKPDIGRLNVVRMLAAPPGLPAELKATLEKAILAAMADPEFTNWLQQTGNDAHPAGAEATAAAVRDLMAFYKNYLHLLKK